MKIKSIHIKNVRGIQDLEIELGEMYPNKPSLMVAPNGSGKSSFACAFKWLNRQRIKLDPADAYQGDENNLPELSITTDEPATYTANNTSNTISSKFGVFVINSALKAKSPGIRNGFQNGSAKIVSETVVLLDNKPANVMCDNDFVNVYGLNGLKKGVVPSADSLMKDNDFMSKIDIEKIQTTPAKQTKIREFIERLKQYQGTKDEIHDKVAADDLGNLVRIPSIAYLKDLIQPYCPDDSEVKLVLKAIQLVTSCYRDRDKFEGRIKYATFMEKEEMLRGFFSMIKTTWNGIRPKEERGVFKIEIGDSQRISNGERDIITFLAMLQKAKMELAKKEYNILVIDEVFDYLDDANMIAAQYYISNMIKEFAAEGRYIFPIIMTHLNPAYYGGEYALKGMKVYYLKKLPHPNVCDNLMKLLRKREEAKRNGQPDDDISRYLLHFHNDYTKDLSETMTSCNPAWTDINAFKAHCESHLDRYLADQVYDPLAVCVALREHIERYCYNRLATDADKVDFINTHETLKKIDFAEAKGVEVPEMFSLLGKLYNDPLHATDRTQKKITQTLFSRMENVTIREMVSFVKQC